MRELGKRLRALRHEEGLTLADLGERVGLSASYLSQIERGITTPSLSKLTTIANTLDVGVAHFFETDISSPRVVKSNQGKRVHDTGDTIVELMSSAPTDKKIQPYRVTCQPGASREQPPIHPGEGFYFVLKGQLTVTVGEETYVLNAGDSIHYQGLRSHSWRNDNKEECIAIWAVSPPIWETGIEEQAVEQRR